MTLSKERLQSTPEMSQITPLENSIISITHPVYVDFPGTTRKLEVQTDLPRNFAVHSRLFPLQKIDLIDSRYDSGQKGKKNTTEFDYKSSQGGKLTIYIDKVWEIARDYIDGNILVREINIYGIPKWWLKWVRAVDEKLQKVPPIVPTSFDSMDMVKKSRLWSELITDLVLTQAVLSRLTINEGLYKKIIWDHENISTIIIMFLQGIPIGTILDFYTAFLASQAVLFVETQYLHDKFTGDMKAKIENRKNNLRKEMDLKGPFVQIGQYPEFGLPNQLLQRTI